MDSYNLVNRAHMTENAPMNLDILKHSWEFWSARQILYQRS